MGNIAKGAVGGIVCGTAFGAASYAMYPRMYETEVEQYTRVEACAQQLPNESAALTGDLPEDCQMYTTYIGTFSTPSPQEFRTVMNARVTTDEQLHEQNKKLALGVAALCSLAGVAVGVGYKAGSRAQRSI